MSDCTCEDCLTEPHSCPYAEDVNHDDDPSYCTCCDECEYQCAAGI